MSTYKVGDVANVKIVKLMTFGAFAEVVPRRGRSDPHLPDRPTAGLRAPPSASARGQMVDAKIIEVDEDKKKISLSIRALLRAPAGGGERRGGISPSPLYMEKTAGASAPAVFFAPWSPAAAAEIPLPAPRCLSEKRRFFQNFC